MAMYRRGLIPLELSGLQGWRDLSSVQVALRAPARLNLVMLWAKRETSPIEWSLAWRKALELKKFRRQGVNSWEIA